MTASIKGLTAADSPVRARCLALVVTLITMPALAGCGKPSNAAPVDTQTAAAPAPVDSAAAALDSTKRNQFLSVLRHARELAEEAPSPAATPVNGGAPANAELRVVTRLPAGASVTVEGVEGQLRAGSRLALPPSIYTLTLNVPGRSPVSARVAFGAGQRRDWPTGVELAASSSAGLSSVASNPAPVQPAATPAGDTQRAPAIVPSLERAPDTRSGGGATKTAITDTHEVATQEITTLLASYANAYQARRIADVLSIYPSMSQDERSRWSAFLESKDIKDLRAQIAGMQPPDIEGNTALVNFSLALDFKASGSGRQTPKFDYRATLKRDANGDWKLISLSSAR